MKAKLEFNLPEEREEYEAAVNGARNQLRIEDIWEELFRPRHKHGYNNERLQQLLADDKVNEALDILEDLYRYVITKYE